MLLEGRDVVAILLEHAILQECCNIAVILLECSMLFSSNMYYVTLRVLGTYY